MQKVLSRIQNFILIVVLSIFFISIFTSCEQGNRPGNREKPNIILIMADDHAKKALSCYHQGLIETPNLDRIASEGIRFNRAFVTNSICAPSRAVTLTGKYSHLNGVSDNSNTFDTSQITFPGLMREDGYETFMMGKWHLKSQPAGFDHWTILPGQGAYYNPTFLSSSDTFKREGYVTNLITDMAIEGLENRDTTKPFCMLYFHKAPHRNWMPDTNHLAMFDGVDLPIPDNFFDDYSERSTALLTQDMKITDLYDSYDLKMKQGFGEKGSDSGSGGQPRGRDFNAMDWWSNIYEGLTPDQRSAWDKHYNPENDVVLDENLSEKELSIWKYQRYIKDYLRTVVSIDENVGRLMSYLKRENILDNTVIIYTSDQGFFLGEHGWYDKRFMYEESMGIPLLIRYPEKLKQGGVDDELVLNLDLAPTILDLAGIGIPKDMQGKSLFSESNASQRDAIYYHYSEDPKAWHHVERHRGIRTNRYKLIHFYDLDEWELYDLEKDKSEMFNLADDKKYDKIKGSLQLKLDSLQSHFLDL